MNTSQRRSQSSCRQRSAYDPEATKEWLDLKRARPERTIAFAPRPSVNGPRDRPSSPFDYADRGCAPLLIVHGDQDTLTPATRARALAERARNASVNPVVYAELPGAQHSFDLLASIRFETVIDGIQAFAASIAAPDLSRADYAIGLTRPPATPSDAGPPVSWRGGRFVRTSTSR